MQQHGRAMRIPRLLVQQSYTGQTPVTNATRVESPSLSTISACRKPITVENKNSTLHLLLEIYAHTDTTQTEKRTVQVK